MEFKCKCQFIHTWSLTNCHWVMIKSSSHIKIISNMDPRLSRRTRHGRFVFVFFSFADGHRRQAMRDHFGHKKIAWWADYYKLELLGAEELNTMVDSNR